MLNLFIFLFNSVKSEKSQPIEQKEADDSTQKRDISSVDKSKTNRETSTPIKGEVSRDSGTYFLNLIECLKFDF